MMNSTPPTLSASDSSRHFLQKPPLWLSYAITLAIVLLVGYLRLYLFDSEFLSLGYGIPLLIVLWHHDRPQMYLMAIALSIISYVKVFLMLKVGDPELLNPPLDFIMTLVTIWTATATLHIVLNAFDRIQVQTQRIIESNHELEASNEELATREEEISRQNAELQSQTEELEHQQEELRQQAEELEQQSTDLQSTNEELARREKGLHTLLESARWLRSDLSERDVISAVCQAAVEVMEEGVCAAAVVQEKDGYAMLRGHYGFGVHGALKRDCSYKASFAALIMEKGQAGFITDLQSRPDIDVPQPLVGKPFVSVLGAPLFLEGKPVGAVEVYSAQPREWTQGEFRIIEWLAAQCALALQSLEHQREVQIKRREAEEASIQKTRFLAAVSHDVRTPANAISLLADLLEQTAATEAMQHDLPGLARDLKSNARILIELLSDVLDLARLDTGKLDIEPVVFSLPDLLLGEVHQFERFAAEKNVRLTTLATDESLCLKTDRLKLARILSNLVGNAVKFTASGSVQLRCELLPAGDVIITVADTGCGIPPTALSRIFEEFYQIQNPERDRNKGSGLGLAICKRLVDALGCALSVHSEIGVGTTFTLKIPPALVVPASDPASASSPEVRAKTHHSISRDDDLSGCKILLVEDHEVTRKAAAKLLAAKGATILQAATGRDAFELLAHEHPHAMLLDLMLPDADGTDILRFLHTHRPSSLKCIFAVSGDVRKERIAEVKRLGADDLIAKPLDIQKLLEALVARLGSRPAERRPVEMRH